MHRPVEDVVPDDPLALHRSQMVTLARGRFGAPASLVMEALRAGGPTTREALAPVVAGSPATLHRTVSALLEAGLVRERPDLVAAGQVGRPRVPVEIDPTGFVVVGVHLGLRRATVAVADLQGRVLAERTEPRAGSGDHDLAALARVAAALVGGQDGARPLAAGLVAPWRDLGPGPGGDPAAGAARLSHELGLPTAHADHIAAVAATEFLHRRATGAEPADGVTLYVYARDSVGHAIAVDKGWQTEVSRVGSLTHFPVGGHAPCGCGHEGCLGATATDQAVLAEAARRQLLPLGTTATGLQVADLHRLATTEPPVRALLHERARTLGRVAGIVRDIVVPHRVVLVGQAFTGWAPGVASTLEAFEAATALGPADVRLTRLTGGLQAAAAATIALGPVYDDPLTVVPPAGRGRRATPGAITGRVGAAHMSR